MSTNPNNDNQFNVIGMIPARWGSSRFPGKPIAMIKDRPMVVRVCDQVSQALDRFWVATDDQRIAEVVDSYGYPCLMTGNHHESGTSRCFEAFDLLDESIRSGARGLINIQADEPLIDPECIRQLTENLLSGDHHINTLIRKEFDKNEYQNPNRVKAVTDANGKALLFTRSQIPHYNNSGEISARGFHVHLSIYGFKTDIISQICQMDQTPLEQAESLEQLRWMEHGLTVHCLETAYRGIGIDTPEDVDKVESLL